MYRFHACICALFSPEILQAGAVKGLKWSRCKQYRVFGSNVASRPRYRVLGITTCKTSSVNQTCQTTLLVYCNLKTRAQGQRKRRWSLKGGLYIYIYIQNIGACLCAVCSVARVRAPPCVLVRWRERVFVFVCRVSVSVSGVVCLCALVCVCVCVCVCACACACV